MTFSFLDSFEKVHLIRSADISEYGLSPMGANTLLVRHAPNGVPTEEHIQFPSKEALNNAIKRLENAQKDVCLANVDNIKGMRQDAIGTVAANVAVNLAMNERNRQRKQEDFTYEHDDEHTNGQLGYMAASYLVPDDKNSQALFHMSGFHRSWYSPGPNETRKLVKGVALAIAELERHIRSKLQGHVITLEELTDKLGITNKCRMCPVVDCPDRKE